MRSSSNPLDNSALLEAALEGLELQKARIDEQISEVRRLMGGRGRSQPAASKSALAGGQEAGAGQQRRTRKPLSAAARKRIAAAQKRRWAEYRNKTEGSSTAKKATKKKTESRGLSIRR